MYNKYSTWLLAVPLAHFLLIGPNGPTHSPPIVCGFLSLPVSLIGHLNKEYNRGEKSALYEGGSAEENRKRMENVQEHKCCTDRDKQH